MITTNPPKIYTFNCERYNGNLGAGSFKVQQPICTACNRELASEIKYAQLEFNIETYNGEDLIFADGCILVSQELFDALEANQIKGYAPVKVKIKKTKHFKGDLKNVKKFIYLAILPPVVKNIPIEYQFAEKCDTCGLMKPDFNTLDMDQMLRTTTEGQEHLKIHHNTWNGNDIFNLLDHTETGITQKFLDTISKYNSPDNVIIPAEWI